MPNTVDERNGSSSLVSGLRPSAPRSPADRISRAIRRVALTFGLCIVSILSIAAAESGLASFYAGKFQGRQTANGEVFDTNKLTAAHKTLPFNSLVRVVNVRNGKSVVVRINDRGPFVSGRVIDLSRAAAAAIDMIADGVAPVTVEVVQIGDGATYHRRPAADTDEFVIQLGSFSVDENARRLREDLQDAGFDAATEPGPDGHVRVILPGVHTRDLSLVLLQLKRAGYENVLVRKTF